MTAPSSKRALVAEDDDGIAKLVELLLKREGFETDVIARGDLVLAKLALRAYDLFILDWNLPYGIGKKILDRACKAYPNLPILVMSGMEIELKEKWPHVVFIQKPFDPTEFRKRARALGQRE